jgi:hypothetical protein
MELAPRQREVLTALLEEYRGVESESAVPGERIAEALDVHVDTLQRQMQSLKALGMAESFPGRGYKPTVRAFEAVVDSDTDASESLRLAHGYERLDVVVDGIDFPNVHDPTNCRARVTFRGRIDDVEPGDAVVIGPTPKSKLVVAGEIVGVVEERDRVTLDVVKLEAPMVA